VEKRRNPNLKGRFHPFGGNYPREGFLIKEVSQDYSRLLRLILPREGLNFPLIWDGN